MRRRGAFSLIEVLVVLVLIGLTTTVTVLAFRPTPAAATGWRSTLVAARHRAIVTGIPVTAFADSVGAFTAYPQGTIITDSAPRARFWLRSDAR